LTKGSTNQPELLFPLISEEKRGKRLTEVDIYQIADGQSTFLS